MNALISFTKFLTSYRCKFLLTYGPEYRGHMKFCKQIQHLRLSPRFSSH